MALFLSVASIVIVLAVHRVIQHKKGVSWSVWCCSSYRHRFENLPRDFKKMSSWICTCVVDTRKSYRASLTCPVSSSFLHLSLLWPNLSLNQWKSTADLPKAAAECDFYSSCCITKGHLKRRLQIVSLLWRGIFRGRMVRDVWACLEIHPQRDWRRSSSPWLGMVITCCHCLQDTLATEPLSWSLLMKM